MTDNNQERGGTFKIHTDKRIVAFVLHESGLHYLDLKDYKNVTIALVTTIRENFEGCTTKQFKVSIKAHCLQAMLGQLSRKDFESMEHANLIVKCPVIPENISHAYELFGKKLAGLRGKTVHQKPGHISRDAIQTNKQMTITVDVRFVNNLPLIITYGRGIGLITAEFIPTQMTTQLACSLKRNVNFCSRAGFVIQTILMEMELDKVISEIPEVVHVAEVEWHIRINKE